MESINQHDLQTLKQTLNNQPAADTADTGSVKVRRIWDLKADAGAEFFPWKLTSMLNSTTVPADGLYTEKLQARGLEVLPQLGRVLQAGIRRFDGQF